MIWILREGQRQIKFPSDVLRVVWIYPYLTTSSVSHGGKHLFSSVQSLSHVRLCDSMNCSMPGLLVHHQLAESTQPMSIKSVMPSNHLIFCHPLFLLPLGFPSIRVFSNECLVKAMIFPVVIWMWELDYKESWALKNWCFWTVVLEKTLASPLDCKEIQLVHPKGDQPWVFFGRNDAEAETPIFWPPHAKSWLIGKDPDAGRDWGQ